MTEEYPHRYEHGFNPTWYDDGRTCEPCPICRSPLYWGEYYSATHHKKMRHLVCRREGGCKYRSKKVTEGAVKGTTEREWLTSRQR